MLRLSPRFWTGAGLFAALLTCGCQQSRCCCSQCIAPAGTAPAANASNVPVVRTSAKIAADAPSRSQAGTPFPTASSPDGATPASADYGHDPNYQWLVGLLAYSWIERTWLVRYVPFEQDDRYGGCVTLVGAISPKQFRPGQIVRVEGRLIDPNSRQLRPAFQVQSIRVNGS
jgi:hypothetical protein